MPREVGGVERGQGRGGLFIGLEGELLRKSRSCRGQEQERGSGEKQHLGNNSIRSGREKKEVEVEAYV